MSSTPNVIDQSKPKKSSVIRKSSVKSRLVQSTVVAKRLNGESKSKISRDLGIARNTVTSIMELNRVEQIEKYREESIGLTPLAIHAVRTDLAVPGNGNLGLRFLESAGILGDNAIDAMRRQSARQHGAINVLVQAGATLHIADTQGNHNVPLSDTTPTNSNVQNHENNSTDTVNKVVTPGQGTLKGKHPKAAPTHQ